MTKAEVRGKQGIVIMHTYVYVGTSWLTDFLCKQYPMYILLQICSLYIL